MLTWVGSSEEAVLGDQLLRAHQLAVLGARAEQKAALVPAVRAAARQLVVLARARGDGEARGVVMGRRVRGEGEGCRIQPSGLPAIFLNHI